MLGDVESYGRTVLVEPLSSDRTSCSDHPLVSSTLRRTSRRGFLLTKRLPPFPRANNHMHRQTAACTFRRNCFCVDYCKRSYLFAGIGAGT